MAGQPMSASPNTDTTAGGRDAWILRVFAWIAIGIVTAVGLVVTGMRLVEWLPSRTNHLSVGEIRAAYARAENGVVLIEDLAGHPVDELCIVGGYEFMDVVARNLGIPYVGPEGFAAEVGEHSVGMLAHGAGRTTYAMRVPEWGPRSWGGGLLGALYRTQCYRGGPFAIQLENADPPSGGRLIHADTGADAVPIVLPEWSRWDRA